MNAPFMMLVALFAAATPSSSTIGSVSVVGVGSCAEGRLDAHVRGLREALWKRMDAAVQSDEEAIRRLGGMSRSSLGDVDRVFSGARYDIDCMAYDRAEQTLKIAAADLLALPPSPERWKRMRDVYALLAWAYVKLENPDAAEEMYARIVRVEPTFILDRKQFPPSTGRLLEKVRTRVAEQATAKLSVTTLPAGLPVYVDGRDIGKSPATLKVPPREYRVEVGFGEGRGIPRTVKVGNAENVELEQAFEGSIYPLAGPCLSMGPERKGRLAALVRLASVLGTRTVVAVSHDDHGTGERYLVATTVDSTTGQETREARVKLYPAGPPAGAFEKLADFLATGDVAPPLEAVRGAQATARSPDPVSAVVLPPPPPPARPEETKVETGTTSRLRILSYALGGAAVVAAVTGGYFFKNASSTRDDLSKLQNSSGIVASENIERYRSLRSRADRDQTIGTALVATGGTALLGAVVTFILSWHGSSSPATVAVSPNGAGLTVRF